MKKNIMEFGMEKLALYFLTDFDAIINKKFRFYNSHCTHAMKDFVIHIMILRIVSLIVIAMIK